jgi:hypothetical protein
MSPIRRGSARSYPRGQIAFPPKAIPPAKEAAVFRRTTITTVAAVITLAGPVLAVVPAHASVAPSAATAPTPGCPMSEAQLAYGRRVIADALVTFEQGVRALGTGWRDRSPTPVENPASATDSQALCMLALNDVKAKAAAAAHAVEQYLQCVADSMNTGANCNNHRGNAEAAMHELHTALSNLDKTCPWLYVPGF